MESLKEVIFALTAAHGTSGEEGCAAEVAKKYLSEFGETRLDVLGNVIGEVLPAGEGKPHILLEAHLDEIGMMVTHITDEGFIKVTAVGGLDTRGLIAAEVTVHTADSPLYGIVTSQPPHLTKPEDFGKAVPMEEIAIDLGFDSKEETAEHVKLGDRVTVNGAPLQTATGRLVSKAMDDRLCCAAILRTLELLKGKALDAGLSVAFATREETGGQGARTAAYAINPTMAVALDVSFADRHYAPKDFCSELGNGPRIGYSPALDSTMSKELTEIAQRQQIPYDVEVMGGRTGTDADGMFTTRRGIPTALLSIPVRYMHNPFEMADLEDVENTARLLAAYILEKVGE